MTKEELQNWRNLMGYTQSQAANKLGYTREQYVRIEGGASKIKKVLELACMALYHKIDVRLQFSSDTE